MYIAYQASNNIVTVAEIKETVVLINAPYFKFTDYPTMDEIVALDFTRPDSTRQG